MAHAFFLSPVGTNDNSPAIYRWETDYCIILVPQGRLKINGGHDPSCFLSGSTPAATFDSHGIAIIQVYIYLISNYMYILH